MDDVDVKTVLDVELGCQAEFLLEQIGLLGRHQPLGRDKINVHRVSKRSVFFSKSREQSHSPQNHTVLQPCDFMESFDSTQRCLECYAKAAGSESIVNLFFDSIRNLTENWDAQKESVAVIRSAFIT